MPAHLYIREKYKISQVGLAVLVDQVVHGILDLLLLLVLQVIQVIQVFPYLPVENNIINLICV